MAKKELNIEDVLSKFSKKKDSSMISTGSIAVDKMLGGGLATGQMYAMWGVCGSGKSTIACQIARSFCKMGKKVLYIDVEQALNENQKESFHLTPLEDEGLFRHIDGVTTFEDLQEVVTSVGKSKAFDLVIVDSMTQVTPSTGDDFDVTSQRPGMHAKQCGSLMTYMHNLFYENGIASILLFHARANLDMGGNKYADKEQMQGGFAAKHVVDCIIKVAPGSKIMSDDGKDEQIGKILHLVTQKNKFAMPLKKFDVKLFFGFGIKKSYEIIDYAVEYGVIENPSNGTYVLPNGEKVRGHDNLYTLGNDVLQVLYDSIKDKISGEDSSEEE